MQTEALQALVEGHRRFLAFVQARVESREEAEDILQSAFVRGLEHSEELRDGETAVAWFYRVLRNAVIDHYRRRAATGRALDTFAREFATPEEAREICGCVSELLPSLKPEYRDALEVVDLGEGTLQALADRSGITAGNAAVRVHRARQALRKQIENACGTCAEHGCLDCQCGASKMH